MDDTRKRFAAAISCFDTLSVIVKPNSSKNEITC